MQHVRTTRLRSPPGRFRPVPDAARPARGAVRPPWEEFSDGIDPYHLRLRAEAGQLFMALSQVGHVGRDDQKARALGILADTRRKLYAILAEEDATSGETGEPGAAEASEG